VSDAADVVIIVMKQLKYRDARIIAEGGGKFCFEVPGGAFIKQFFNGSEIERKGNEFSFDFCGDPVFVGKP
jgi:hypothetical protein